MIKTGTKPFILTFTLSETYKLIPRKQRLLFYGVLFLQLLLSIFFIRTQSITIDEGGYFSYAVQWAKGDLVRRMPSDDSKSPIVAPSLIPRVVKQLKDPLYKPTDYGQHYMLQGRYFMWVFVLFGSCIFLCWGYRLYGNNGWLLPLVLLLFDPLFFSYGMIIGSDMAAAVMLFGLCYVYWRYRQSNKRRYLLFSGIFLGLGIITKLSLLFILPLGAIIFLVRSIFYKNYRTKIRAKLIDGLLLFIVSLFIINAVYFFKGSCNVLNNLPAESKVVNTLKSVPVLNKIPIPLPYSFLQSIDMSLHHAEIGGGRENSTYSGIFLDGVYKQDGVLWYYYLVMLWYKMPIFILMLAATLIFYTVGRKRAAFDSNKLYYLIPIFYFLFTLSFFNSFQIGIRHLLIIFPFIYLALGEIIAVLINTKWRYVFFTLLLVHFALLFKIFPHWMAYTNEIIWNKKEVNRHIVDCSVDYGQSGNFMAEFLKEHPDYKYPTAIPGSGKFIVELRNLAHEWKSDPDTFGWLRENFTPTAEYATVFLLYDVTADDLKKIK